MSPSDHDGLPTEPPAEPVHTQEYRGWVRTIMKTGAWELTAPAWAKKADLQRVKSILLGKDESGKPMTLAHPYIRRVIDRLDRAPEAQ